MQILSRSLRLQHGCFLAFRWSKSGTYTHETYRDRNLQGQTLRNRYKIGLSRDPQKESNRAQAYFCRMSGMLDLSREEKATCPVESVLTAGLSARTMRSAPRTTASHPPAAERTIAKRAGTRGNRIRMKSNLYSGS